MAKRKSQVLKKENEGLKTREKEGETYRVTRQVVAV
jgi:hypothetical protein